MIVVDPSALVAILTAEDDAREYGQALVAADRPLISAASLVEAGVVMNRRQQRGGIERVEALVREADIEVVAVTADHARIALEAFRRFGKGTGARARLNFGDCFSYALAKATGLPLLFKGEDFRLTDLESVLN